MEVGRFLGQRRWFSRWRFQPGRRFQSKHELEWCRGSFYRSGVVHRDGYQCPTGFSRNGNFANGGHSHHNNCHNNHHHHHGNVVFYDPFYYGWGFRYTDTITVMVTRVMKLTRLLITKVATAMKIIRSRWTSKARWPIADIIADRSMVSSETGRAAQCERFNGRRAFP